MPRAPGEAIIGVDAAQDLHLADGVGTVAVKSAGAGLDAEVGAVPVVGTFDASGTLERFNSSILIEGTQPTLRQCFTFTSWPVTWPPLNGWASPSPK